jgi:hypothetical protein
MSKTALLRQLCPAPKTATVTRQLEILAPSLAKIRDTAVNTMSRVAAVRALEQLDEEGSARPANAPSPGVVIKIINQGAVPPAIDVSPRRPVSLASPPLSREPIFMGGPSDEDCTDEPLTR